MPYNNSMKVKRLRLIFLIFWLILAGLIVWFKVVPNGQVTYSMAYPNKINLFGGKGFIGNLTPADRVEIKAGELAKISGDPVYFSVFTPRTFSEAKVTITYRDNLASNTPLIESGVLVDNIVWRYQLASLENKLLDNSFSGWEKIVSDNLVLWQKNKTFSDLNQFLETVKTKPETICSDGNLKTCLALYNTDFISSYKVEKIPEFQVINIPLQGAHQFYFIAKAKQPLKFSFDFADLNLDKKGDPVVISIYKGTDKIYSNTLTDNFGGDGLGQVRNFSLPLSYSNSSSSTELYKLEIKVGEDIVIKKIKEAPSALLAIERLHPVNANSLPLSFWTDSSFINLTTNNPASKQTIRFGDQDFALNESYQQFEFLNNNLGLKKVSLKKDDVILETDGVFSFSADSFFNPEFKKVNQHFVLTPETQYVLASYQTPLKKEDNFKQASVVLNTKDAYRENGKYSFMISVPGLSLAQSGNLEISNITVEFSGRTIWDKIKEKISTYVN